MKKQAKRKTKRNNSSNFKYLKRQLKEALKWLSEYKWAASGVSIFVFIIYLNSFIHVEKIPLSIISSYIVSSSPIIIPYFAFHVALLILYAFAPMLAFFTPVGNKNGKDQFIAPSTDDEFKGVSLKLAIWWLLVQFLIFLALFIAEITEPKLVILFVLTIPLLAALYLKATSLIRVSFCGINAEFWFSLVFSIILQAIIVLLVFVFVFEEMKNGGPLFAYLIAFSWPLLIAAAQLALMKFMRLSWRRGDFFKRSILSLLLIVCVLGFWPTSGAFLFGNFLRHTASGARPCAVVFWTQTRSAAELGDFVDKDNPDQSRPLRIFMDVDGDYIVRILTTEQGKYIERKQNGRKDTSVRFIPRTLVAGIDTCPSLGANKQASQLKKQGLWINRARHFSRRLNSHPSSQA